jgi:predicted nucleic acid-binding protein
VRVVDTNIIAYLLLQGDRTTAARALLAQDSDWRSDSFVLVEFSNVLATMVRNRLLAPARAHDALGNAEQIIEPGLHPTAHRASLTTAEEFGVSVYDARFLVVAQTLRARLVTEDARLRHAAPSLTQSLEEALA